MIQLSLLLSLVPFFAAGVVSTLSKPGYSTPPKFPGLDWLNTPRTLSSDVVYQFPVGTWVENLAIRQNGKILTTTLSSPELLQVDNEGRKPVKLIHTFPHATSCTGIARIGLDTFYVIAGNFSLGSWTGVPGSWAAYKIDLRLRRPHITRRKPVRVSLVATFPDSAVLNGITVLSKHRQWLLVSDSGAGVVYRLDAKSGRVFKVLQDPLMAPDSPSGFGINGIKVRNGMLYFTNSDRNLVARILLRHDGTSKAAAAVVAHLDGPDDFTFDEGHNMVVAQSGVNLLARVAGNEVSGLAGGISKSNGTVSQLFGPTAVRFQKNNPFFVEAYISTNGGTAQYLTGNVTRGGTISVVYYNRH